MKSIRILAIIFVFLLIFVQNSFAIDFHGVCVGINDYPGWVNDLSYCVNDASQMRLKLIYEQSWDGTNIDLITDSRATESNIENAIQSMPRNNSHTDLFHFSGHGSYNGIIPVDDWNYISPYELQTNFGNSYYRYTSFLDACHSGIFPDNMSRGVIESACRANEYAAETSSLQHGIFSNFLIEGLTNNAADPDGIVSAEELFYYAAPKTTNYNPNQHPQLSDNWSGYLNLSLPPAPRNLTISNASHTGENPILDWQAPISTDISGYYVYRKRESGTWQQISGKISGTSYTDDEVTIDPNNGNNYYYHVKAVDYCDALSEASNDVSTHGYLGKEFAHKENDSDKIYSFRLYACYPNPANPYTTIRYQVPRAEHVVIAICDIQGRLVETLVDGEKTAGRYSVQWHGENVPSGVYFYRIQAGHFTATKKLLLLK